MKQRMIALTLTLTLLLAAAVSAFAVEPAAGTAETVSQTEETAPQQDAAQENADAAEETADGETEEPAPVAAPAPVPAGKTVQFGEVKDLVKEKNLTYRALQASIDASKEAEDMVDALDDSIAQLENSIDRLDPSEEDYAATRAYLEGKLAEVQQARSGMNAMVQDTAQMKGGANQLMYGAEATYIGIVIMEQEKGALERKLTALDRQLEELRVRAKWGQISQLQLQEAESGRASLVSGLTTLEMNIVSYKMQLEQMIGEEVAGTIVMSALPEVSAAQLNGVDYENDLKQAKSNSHELRSASYTEDKTFDAVRDLPAEMNDVVDSMLEAAHYTYKGTEQQVELKFRTLYLKLQDQQQVLAAAQAALELEQQAYQAEELKYQHGTISKNALLSAEDELKTAQETVRTAKNDLFSAYNNYRWAVDYGVLN